MGCEQKSVSVWAWMRAVRQAPQEVLDVVTKAVLYTLALYADPDGGSCFPGQERLASDCGLHVRTVRKKLQKARKAGFLEAHTRRYGMYKTSNLYELVIPGEARTPSSPGKSGKPADEEAPEALTKRPQGPSRLEGPWGLLPTAAKDLRQTTSPSNARARVRGGGKPAWLAKARRRQAAGQLRLLWMALMLPGQAPDERVVGEATEEEVTTALAWTIHNMKKNNWKGKQIRNVAGYYVSMLRTVQNTEEKAVSVWTQDDLWSLMGSDLSPDEFRKHPKA